MTKKKDPKDLLKNGRKSTFTEALADEICEAISSHPLSLRTLCQMHPHWPTQECIFRWLYKFPTFGHKYAIAKENQVETSVDLLNQVLEEDHHYHDNDGNKRVDATLLRVKVDAIKWQAGKLKPKKYADALQAQQQSTIHQDVMQHKSDLDEKNKKDY
jgi:hypothetical protein